MAVSPVSSQVTGLPDRFYTVEGDKFVRVQVTRTPLSNMDEVLRNLASESPVISRAIGIVDDLPVIQVTTVKAITLAMKLPAIKLATCYTVRPALNRRGPARLVPTFARAGHGDPLMTLPWKPPGDMRMWFILNFRPEPEMDGGGRKTGLNFWKVGYAYLVATCTAAGNEGTYRPQLPNVFENAKLCLGRDPQNFQTDTNVPLLKVFSDSYQEFVANTWNSDLMNLNNTAIIEACFSWNADTNEQLPVPEDWSTQWLKINNADVSTVPYKLLQ